MRQKFRLEGMRKDKASASIPETVMTLVSPVRQACLSVICHLWTSPCLLARFTTVRSGSAVIFVELPLPEPFLSIDLPV